MLTHWLARCGSSRAVNSLTDGVVERRPSILRPSITALSICPHTPSILLFVPLFSALHCGVEEMHRQRQRCQCTNIQSFSHLPPPTSSTHPASIIPIFIFLDAFILLCFRGGSFLLFSLLLHFPAVGRTSRRHVESHSLWCLAALLSLCTTSLHHANLWLALHRGPLTTHACLHATLLWIEEITLTLTLRAKTLAGWLSALTQHSQLLSHSYSIHKCFVSKSAYCKSEKWQVLKMLNIALLALMCEKGLNSVLLFTSTACVEELNRVKMLDLFLCK